MFLLGMVNCCLRYDTLSLRGAEGDVAIPKIEGNTIENCPAIWGIATPACALVRDDRSFLVV
jgi:hypothetical protein